MAKPSLNWGKCASSEWRDGFMSVICLCKAKGVLETHGCSVPKNVLG